MKGIGVCSGFIILSGCMTSDGLETMSQSENNIENLSRITIGMNEGEVMQKMHAPYSEETFTIGLDQYDVWFYVTNPTLMGQTRMVHFNLTPLTFKNDVLVSIGWDYYKNVKKQSLAGPAPQTPPAPPLEPNETKNLYEDALQAPAPQASEAAPASQANEPAETPAPAEPQNESSPPSPENSDGGTTPLPRDEALENILQPTPAPAPITPEPPKAEPTPKEKIYCPGLLETKTGKNSQKSSLSDNSDTEPKPKSDEESEPTDPKKKRPVDMDEEDDERLQDGSEQDFNFW